MLRRGLLFVLILLLSLSFAGFAAAQDDEDPDVFAPPVLESGEQFVDSIESIAQPRLYTFLGSAGDTVTITMQQEEGSMLDPYLVLLGSAGEVYANDDDSGPVSLSAQISEFELPFDGAYFVLVTTYNDLIQGGLPIDAQQNDEPLFYTISLEGATLPDGFDTDELDYFAVEVGLEDAVLLEVTPDEPVYYVNFLGNADEVVNVVTENNGDDFVTTLVYVFDRSGERIAAASGDNDDDFYAVIEGLELPEDGIYFVFATARDFFQSTNESWSGDGEFVFVIE